MADVTPQVLGISLNESALDEQAHGGLAPGIDQVGKFEHRIQAAHRRLAVADYIRS